MVQLEITLVWAAVGLYLVSALTGWIALLWLRERWLRISIWLVTLGVFVHTVPLLARWIRIGHGPYINAYEVLSASVWAGLFGLAALSLRSPTVRWAVGPASLISVVLLGWGVLSNPEVQPLPPTFKSIWLAIHVIGAKLSYGSILIASGLSVVYLLLARRQRPAHGAAEPAEKDAAGKPKRRKKRKSKSAKASGKLRRQAGQVAAEPAVSLPQPGLSKLDKLDELSYRLVALGLVFCSFMIAAGSIWARDAWGRYWSWDPLETWSLITWIAYGLALHVRMTYRIRNKPWAFVVLGLLLLSIFAFFVAALVSPTIHVEFMVA